MKTVNRMFVAANVLHLLSLSLWCGGAVFFSLVVAPAVFEQLRDRLPADPPPGVSGITPAVGRRLAGDTVGAIFPPYFVSQVVVGCLAVASGIVLVRLGDRLAKRRTRIATAALFMVTAHALTIYPWSIQVLNRHYEAEAQGAGGEAAELRSKFGALHGVSQLLNLAVMLLVVAAIITAGLGSPVTPDGGRHRDAV